MNVCCRSMAFPYARGSGYFARKRRFPAESRLWNTERKKSIRACVIWDVDGTMVDTTALIVDSLDHIYRRHYGRTLPVDALRALIGTPLRKQIRVFGEPEAFGGEEEAITADFIG